MNLHEILQFINYVCNKEETGNTLTPIQYNIILKTVNIKLFSNFDNLIGLEIQLNLSEILINL